MTTIAADGHDFSPHDAWEAIRSRASRVGSVALRKLLTAWYVATDPDTPEWARAALGGALVYFALPIDAVPDLLPGIGYTDDIGVLGVALTAAATCIKPRHVKRASKTWERWSS